MLPPDMMPKYSQEKAESSSASLLDKKNDFFTVPTAVARTEVKK